MKKRLLSLALFVIIATGALYAPVILEDGTSKSKPESQDTSIETIFNPIFEQLKPVGEAASNWLSWAQSQAASLLNKVMTVLKEITDTLWNELQSFQSAKLSEKQVTLARQKLADLKNKSDIVMKNALDQAMAIASKTGLKDIKTVMTLLLAESKTLDTQEKALKDSYLYAKVASDLAQKAINNLPNITIKSLENTIHALTILIHDAQTLLVGKSNERSESNRPFTIHAKPLILEAGQQESILFPHK